MVEKKRSVPLTVVNSFKSVLCCRGDTPARVLSEIEISHPAVSWLNVIFSFCVGYFLTYTHRGFKMRLLLLWGFLNDQ